MRWCLLALVACGTPPRPEPPPRPPDAWRHVKLLAGTMAGYAQRVTFELAFDGDRATLVETNEHGPRGATLEVAERASWEVRSTRTYTGARRREGGAVMLELASPGVQPLHLRCTAQQVQVAAAGARRVPAGGGGGACDPGAWQPPELAPVEALVCGEATQPAADEDDDDRLVFGRTPGIEYAFVNNDCELQGGGLRRAR
jgi:hypothetical protein